MNLIRIASFSLLVGAATLSQADILVNTFGSSGQGFFPTVGWTVNSDQWLGKTFSIADSYTLTNIDIALIMNSESDQMLVNLRSDTGGQPGDILESFSLTNQFGEGTAGVYQLTSALNPLMAAGTYYVTIETVDGATGKWNMSNAGGQGALVVSNDGGGSWTHFTDINGTVRVEGTMVPEPASLAALALGGLVLARKRRKK